MENEKRSILDAIDTATEQALENLVAVATEAVRDIPGDPAAPFIYDRDLIADDVAAMRYNIVAGRWETARRCATNAVDHALQVVSWRLDRASVDNGTWHCLDGSANMADLAPLTQAAFHRFEAAAA
jgi:hypothetical protein